MLVITCFFLLLALTDCADVDPPATCTGRIPSPELSWESKLNKYLSEICPDKRKMPPEDRTYVTVLFTLKSFFFDAGEEVFSIYTLVSLQWNDYRFTWDPKDYGGINNALISALNTWTPMDTFQNSKSVEEYGFMWIPECEVKSNGKMVCNPRTIFEVICVSKLAAWPYDTQRCRFEFKFQRSSNSPRAVFRFMNTEDRVMKMLGAEYGGAWNIIDYEQGEDRKNETFFIELTIERQAIGLGAMLTAPAIVLMLLTISTMFLDVCGSVRPAMSCLSLLSHFSVLELINYSIPQHGLETPNILIYIRASLVMTAFTVMISFIFNRITKSRHAPPTLISVLNTRVQNTPLRYIVRSIPQISTVSETLTKIHNNEWMDFVSLVNNLILAIYVILYLTFYMMYIPSPPPLI